MLQNIKKIKFVCDRCGVVRERDAPLVDAIRAVRAEGWQVSDDRANCWCPACKPARNREIKQNRGAELYDYCDLAQPDSS
jgi:hypothetical protein